jgi:hypothetical protein
VQDGVIVISRRDQPVRIVLADSRYVRFHFPPRRASSSCRTRMSAGTPPLIITPIFHL